MRECEINSLQIRQVYLQSPRRRISKIHSTQLHIRYFSGLNLIAISQKSRFQSRP